MKYRENFPCFEIFTIGFGVIRCMDILGVIDFASFIFISWIFVYHLFHSFDLKLLNKMILDTDLVIRLVHKLLKMLLPLAIAKGGVEIEVVNLVSYQTFELSFGLHVQRIRRNAHSP